MNYQMDTLDSRVPNKRNGRLLLAYWEKSKLDFFSPIKQKIPTYLYFLFFHLTNIEKVPTKYTFICNSEKA